MPTQTHPTDAQAVAQVLVEAATVAGYAPSIQDSQPWRWRVAGTRLDLFADHTRALEVTDPDGRLATLSCGAALHHARIGLAAQGWRASLTRMPDPGDRGHLARLRVLGRAPVELTAVRRTHTIRLRRTDRRPVTGPAVGTDDLVAIGAAARAEGGWLHILRPDQVLDLAGAAGRAQQTETADLAWRAELGYWADRTAAYAVLYGRDDQPLDWLRAGEALSSAWLVAVELGVSVLPLSAVVAVADTRQTIRQLVADLGHPYLVLRLGRLEVGPPLAPRLPVHQIIDRPPPKAPRTAADSAPPGPAS